MRRDWCVKKPNVLKVIGRKTAPSSKRDRNCVRPGKCDYIRCPEAGVKLAVGYTLKRGCTTLFGIHENFTTQTSIQHHMRDEPMHCLRVQPAKMVHNTSRGIRRQIDKACRSSRVRTKPSRQHRSIFTVKQSWQRVDVCTVQGNQECVATCSV